MKKETIFLALTLMFAVLLCGAVSAADNTTTTVAPTVTTYHQTTNHQTTHQNLASANLNASPNVEMFKKSYTDPGTYTNTATSNSITIGTEKYGYVVKYGPYGNPDSTEKVAYIIGVHPLEQIAHESLKKQLEAITDLTKQYYIYQVLVTEKTSNYNQGRMNGQLLAQKYVVPDILAYR